MRHEEEWVVWNGGLGMLALAALGRVETFDGGRRAFLASPFDGVGPICLDELEASGRISLGECLVMSRLRWQEDQAELRREAFAKRRALRARPSSLDVAHREALGLSGEGALEAVEIRAAFRRLAKAAHPDAGGSSERYRRIVEARDELLARHAGAQP